MDLQFKGRRAIVAGSSVGIVVTPGVREFVASPLARYINGANLRIDGSSTTVG